MPYVFQNTGCNGNIDLINDMMDASGTKYKRGEHPNTKKNLKLSKGRSPIYDEPKKDRYLSITDTGWQGMQHLAHSLRCTSVSQLLEKAGRGEIPVGQQNG